MGFADDFHVVEKLAVITRQAGKRGDRFARINGAAAAECDHGVAAFTDGHRAALFDHVQGGLAWNREGNEGCAVAQRFTVA